MIRFKEEKMRLAMEDLERQRKQDAEFRRAQLDALEASRRGSVGGSRPDYEAGARARMQTAMPEPVRSLPTDMMMPFTNTVQVDPVQQIQAKETQIQTINRELPKSAGRMVSNQWQPREGLGDEVRRRDTLQGQVDALKQHVSQPDDESSLTPMGAPYKIGERPMQYTAENLDSNMGRIQALAALPKWTAADKAEAKEILDAMTDGGSPWQQLMYGLTGDGEKYQGSYLQTRSKKAVDSGDFSGVPQITELYNTLSRKVHEKATAAVMGLFDGTGASSFAKLGATGLANAAGEEAKQIVAERLGTLDDASKYSAENSPGTYTAGNVAGNLALLGGLQGATSSAMGAFRALGKLPGIVKAGLSSAVSFGGASAIADAGALAMGEISEADYAKNVGISALGGVAGSVAGNLASTGIKAALVKHKLQTPFMEFLRLTTSGTAFAGGRIAATYPLLEEKPTGRQIANDLATAFLFSMVTAGIDARKTTIANKTRLEQLQQQMMQDYTAMTGGSLSAEDMQKAAERVREYSAAMRKLLGRDGLYAYRNTETGASFDNYFAGQQKMVDDMLRALDAVDDYVGSMAKAAAPVNVPENMLGGTATATGDGMMVVGKPLAQVPMADSPAQPIRLSAGDIQTKPPVQPIQTASQAGALQMAQTPTVQESSARTASSPSDSPLGVTATQRGSDENIAQGRAVRNTNSSSGIVWAGSEFADVEPSEPVPTAQVFSGNSAVIADALRGKQSFSIRDSDTRKLINQFGMDTVMETVNSMVNGGEIRPAQSGKYNRVGFESLTQAYAGATMPAQAQNEMEGMDYGAGESASGGPRRVAGVGAGGPGGGVAAGAGGGQAPDAAGTASGQQRAAALTGQIVQAVSSRQQTARDAGQFTSAAALGLQNGSTAQTLLRIPREAYDLELEQAAQMA